LGLERTEPAKPAGAALPIASSRMGHLWDALTHAYQVLGFEQAAAGTRCSGSWCWPASLNTYPGRTQPGSGSLPQLTARHPRMGQQAGRLAQGT
jgi:hypothetical protein